jgi:RNA-directed DNA polymerase
VVDRFIQQAVMQVLQGRWDGTFSEHSYGFRPGRSAHQAVAQAQQYVAEGYEYVVDVDVEKYFDRVNHDMLMARVAKRVADKRLLGQIRAFLEAGVVMEEGLVKATEEGVPQGGPVRARPVWQHGDRNGWQAWRGVTRGWGWAVAQSALA